MSRFKLRRLRSWLAHAFAVAPEAAPLDPEDLALIARVADLVVRRRMATPAVMLLESVRPLSFLGSQFMQFVKPFATLALNPQQYERFTRLLERREGVGLLLDAIGDREGRRHE
jgi:hypothetical protein